MLKKRVILFSILALAILISSCSFEKRLYRSGYYFEKHNAPDTKAPKTFQDSRATHKNFFENLTQSKPDTNKAIQKRETAPGKERKDSLRADSIHPVPWKTQNQVSDSSSLSDHSGNENQGGDTRHKIFFCQELAIAALALSAVGLIIGTIGISTLIAPLFLGGFFLAGIGECMAIIDLVLIARLKQKYPQMRNPDRKSAQKFSNPYLTSKPADDEWEVYKKARWKAEFFSWLCFLVIGLGFSIAFAAILEG